MKRAFMCRKVISLLFLLLVFTQSCVPDKSIQFKSVKNILIDGSGGKPMLMGQAHFFNPNKIKMKLRAISVDILVNEKNAAQVRQKMNLLIPGNSDFQVPLQAQLDLKEIGLLDTIVGLFGGKKYRVQFVGSVEVSVHGVRVTVPVNYTEEMKLKF